MSTVAVSRPNYTSKKNKENAQPGQAGPGKSFVKREVSKFTKPAAPLQLKGNEKETVGNGVSFKATDKQVDTMSVSSVSSSKSAPGLYKGKIVQSKIGSLWKSGASVSRAEPRPAAPKSVSKKTGNLTKSRSESVGDVPGRGSRQPAPPRFKPVSTGHVHVSKPPAASSLPKPGLVSSRPPVRTVPGTLRSASSRNTTAAPTKRSGIQNAQPKIPVTDKKVNKPSVGSSLSQYRSTETLEERRAKLAEWLASKGKTLKRPAMIASAATAKTKVCAKPKVDVKPQSPSHGESLQAEAQHDPEPCVEAQKVDSAAEPCAEEPQAAASVTLSRTPVFTDISLDLFENSDEELQDSVDDIIVNLCDALEAMEPPSRCNDEQMAGECCAEIKVTDECKKEKLRNDDVREQPATEQMKEESDEQTTEEEEVESDDLEDASVVKYSVKTTPYLQSVRKSIHDVSTSKRKSNIKDLKFLTPVRRSSRIQRKSSHLPSMLVDHDPCVSSLAELVSLDDDLNAYIYRKNPALLENLPDEPRM